MKNRREKTHYLGDIRDRLANLDDAVERIAARVAFVEGKINNLPEKLEDIGILRGKIEALERHWNMHRLLMIAIVILLTVLAALLGIKAPEVPL